MRNFPKLKFWQYPTAITRITFFTLFMVYLYFDVYIPNNFQNFPTDRCQHSNIIQSAYIHNTYFLSNILITLTVTTLSVRVCRMTFNFLNKP